MSPVAMELFSETRRGPVPLADRMRPASFEEYVGQEEQLGFDRPLTRLITSGVPPPSLVLWGPPGSGKTTFEPPPPFSSRCRVLRRRPLQEPELRTILDRALKGRERGLGRERIEAEPAALDWIARMSHGDAREALNLLELGVNSAPKKGDGT